MSVYVRAVWGWLRGGSGTVSDWSGYGAGLGRFFGAAPGRFWGGFGAAPDGIPKPAAQKRRHSVFIPHAAASAGNLIRSSIRSGLHSSGSGTSSDLVFVPYGRKRHVNADQRLSAFT